MYLLKLQKWQSFPHHTGCSYVVGTRLIAPQSVAAFVLFLLMWTGISHAQQNMNSAVITHGPVLGAPGSQTMAIWVRTSEPVDFTVSYLSSQGHIKRSSGSTKLSRDNTGTITLSELRPNTRYQYVVSIDGSGDTASGNFKTLPHPHQYRNPQYNPRGLFNFSFETACGNYMDPRSSQQPAMPTYATMNKTIRQKIDFQIMNGDFIYEDGRGTTVSDWQQRVGISADDTPEIVDIAPDIVGIWENYKRYYDRSSNLREWHRHVPAFFMFDDHEIRNDINGTGTPGFRDQVTVLRDIGIQAWYDYVGWSNPTSADGNEKIIFGKAQIDSRSSTLFDPKTDFSSVNPSSRPTLHIHWNKDHENAGVYKIEKVLDPHTIKLSPRPKADAPELSYSIGRQSYYRFKVANADFFVLDTRTNRQLHDIDKPDMENLSMLGQTQKSWLIKGMKESTADFLFVVSSVSFTIPHLAPDIENKDESWTVFLDEREKLMHIWDQLEQPVILLTGDLHNSIAIEISDNIHEFVSSPHNSGNHFAYEEGKRPPSGKFTYNDRTVDIHWSSYFREGTPRSKRNKKFYVVFSINNVINNPTNSQDRWIAFPQPQLVVQYYNGVTGELEYAESILAADAEKSGK